MQKPYSIVQTIHALANRLESAQALVRDDAVQPTTRPDLFMVGSPAAGSHRVTTGKDDRPAECTCQDFRFRGRELRGWCKHRLAVEIFVQARAEEQAALDQRNQQVLERELADLY